ncbi:uncharacterized protein LOC144448467 [Glandiceps talaboti]
MSFLAQKLMLVSFILVLWCLIDTEADDFCNGESGVYYTGVDLAPTDEHDYYLDIKKKECCRRCFTVGGCVAWVYYPEKENEKQKEKELSKCYLKSRIGDPKDAKEGVEVYSAAMPGY